MTPSFRRIFLFLLAVGIGPGFLAALYADNAVPAPAPGLGPAGVRLAPVPPPPPMPKSPVDSFRELLAMSPAEQQQFLAKRPSEIRKRFLAKIREYEAMKSEERELRLRATELRWYLLPLMQSPSTNRAAQLAAIPEADRQLVKERIRQWDLLSSAQQKEFLEFGLTASYFVGQDAKHPDAASKASLEKIPPPELIKKIDYVSKLPPDQRRQMYEGFQHFFDLTEADRQKTLDVLSPAERQQMKRTLGAFMILSKSQRDECLRSFGKFASMTDEERRAFFLNAERWKEMPPPERQAWRNLVNRFPPMPPIRPPMPPLPPGFRPSAAHTAVPVATNQSP